MGARWTRLREDIRGATALEYGLIVGLIALALVAVLATFSEALGLKFDHLGTSINSARAAG